MNDKNDKYLICSIQEVLDVVNIYLMSKINAFRLKIIEIRKKENAEQFSINHHLQTDEIYDIIEVSN